MAWRDSRRQRNRLLLFVASIVVGIAALVAIDSFGDNLQRDIDREAKTLLGADLVIEGNQPLPDSLLPLVDSLGASRRAEAVNFVSMVFFPREQRTRLAQIRAVEGGFPFYGSLATTPPEAAGAFGAGAEALVEKTLMLQFGVEPGDSVQVGNQTFEVLGQLDAAPGRAGIAGSIAPVVLIPKRFLEATGLIQPGSRVFYQYYFQFPEDAEVDLLAAEWLEPALRDGPFDYETVASRQEDISEAFSNLTTFLNLVAFIALLLGCIGVASSVHIYLKEKHHTIAVLRCLGMRSRQALQIYLVQVLVLGLGGSALGVVLGSLLQFSLPYVLGDFLPLQQVSTDLSWAAAGAGLLTGLLVTVLFALLPLVKVRRVPPLKTLRASFEGEADGKDPLRWVVIGLIVVFVCSFTVVRTGELRALSFPVALGVAFALLAGVARLLTWSLRRFFPRHWSYLWRQSIANLYRPNNQTLLLLVTIGLGTLLIATLFFVQDLLLKQVEFAGAGNQPNMIVFDIQTPQREAVASLARDHELPLLQQVPIVTMRLEAIDGKTKQEARADSTRRISRWVFDREYRVTYRDTLIESEKIIEGTWHGEVGPDGTIYVSIAENIADNMQVKPGSRLTWNVQGARLETVVGSIRKVDFNRVQTNFFVVFPKGVLEQAPQFHVIVSRAASEAQSAAFQRAAVQAFPNVSVIDLSQILKAVESVLDKVSFVIRFMALFSILTGFIVLISSVALSRFQRIRESVLLRTLGAVRRQILAINALEYLILGFLGALTGVGLSVLFSWALARWELEIPFEPNWLPVLTVLLVIPLLTVGIGLLNSRAVVTQSPLEVLRKEL